MTTALLSEVGRGGVESGETIRAVPLSPEDVGERIARAREEVEPKPWSQFDLALAMHVSPSTIYRWEKGKLPSMSELVRLAEVLGKPVDYLTEPPERQAEIVDLRTDLDRILRFLEERRVEAERVQEAGLENLAAIHDRLSRIEERLGLPGALPDANQDPR